MNSILLYISINALITASIYYWGDYKLIPYSIEVSGLQREIAITARPFIYIGMLSLGIILLIGETWGYATRSPKSFFRYTPKEKE